MELFSNRRRGIVSAKVVSCCCEATSLVRTTPVRMSLPQIAWLGYRQTNVFFERRERKFGETGYPFSKMLKFALDGITGFSDFPLQFVTKTGIFISFISFLVILYAIFSHFILQKTITGWTSLIISSMFIGGVQLISIGIIGEYISRINKNVQNRPLYIVSDTNILPKD